MAKRGRKKSGILLENPSTAEEAGTTILTVQECGQMDIDTNAVTISHEYSSADVQFANSLTSSAGANMNYISDEDHSAANAIDTDNTADNEDMNMEQTAIQEVPGKITPMIQTKAERTRKMVDWDNDDEEFPFKHNNSDWSPRKALTPCRISTGTPTRVILYSNHTEYGFTHKYGPDGASGKQTTTYRCIDDNCPLCCAGIARYPRRYHPAFNVLTGNMEVLQYMQFSDRGSLFPQIKAIIKNNAMPVALSIRAHEGFEYEVTVQALSEKTRDCGLHDYTQFMKYLMDTNITLDSIHESVDATLLQDSKLRRLLEFNNYALDSFFKTEDEYVSEFNID